VSDSDGVSDSDPAGGVALPTMPLDGVDQWPCLTKGGDFCTRKEMVYNLDLVCDTGEKTPLSLNVLDGNRRFFAKAGSGQAHHGIILRYSEIV
jgi:hypothetical protein